jgi:hypothetical protein
LSEANLPKQRHPLVLFWTYTLLRIIVFAVLFGLLWVFGLRGLIGAAVALLLSIPLSYVLLRRQRDAMAGQLHQRFVGREQKTADLDAALGGERPEDDAR